jgi:hypothetical protein
MKLTEKLKAAALLIAAQLPGETLLICGVVSARRFHLGSNAVTFQFRDQLNSFRDIIRICMTVSDKKDFIILKRIDVIDFKAAWFTCVFFTVRKKDKDEQCR